MDRKTKLKALRGRRALARKAFEVSETPATRAALDDAETELENAEADATDDERLSTVSTLLMPLIDQLSQTAAEPTKSWTDCVRLVAVMLEDLQRSKKDGSPLDPDRLGGQVEALIVALTRIRPV